MIKNAVASQYSRALIGLAASEEQLTKRLTALEAVINLLDNTPALNGVLQDPHFKPESKKTAVKRLFAGHVDEVLLNFLLLLIEKGRFNYLPAIGKEYRRLAKLKLNILEARLISAVPLEKAMKEEMQGRLEKAFRKKVEIQSEVVPDILGGIIVMAGHQMLDESLKERLAKLKESLLAAKV